MQPLSLNQLGQVWGTPKFGAPQIKPFQPTIFKPYKDPNVAYSNALSEWAKRTHHDLTKPFPKEAHDYAKRAYLDAKAENMRNGHMG